MTLLATHTLKSDETLTISKSVVADSEALIGYLNTVGGQTDFLSYGKNEFHCTVEQEREILAQCLESDMALSLVAKIDGKIISSLHVDRSPIARLSHIADMGITVDQAYWGLGVGSMMMEVAINWAKSKGVVKMMFLVDVRNERAIKMYERLGAEKQGTVTKATKIGDDYFDNHLMAIALD